MWDSVSFQSVCHPSPTITAQTLGLPRPVGVEALNGEEGMPSATAPLDGSRDASLIVYTVPTPSNYVISSTALM